MWRDLGLLARLDPADGIAMRSSTCPGGCREDFHGRDHSRFLRVEGDEGVLFEDDGAGAITRIWVTTGENGVSRPLDPAIRLRIRLDGARTPVVDLPLVDLFGGSSPPFVPPLVSDRTVSSGGNVCYVPIPYRAGCRVSLVGAADATLWFQVTARRLADPSRVTSFSGREDLSAWATLLGSDDPDPWRGRPFPVESGSAAVAAGKTVSLARLHGPDVVNGLLLQAPVEVWPELELVLRFDGEVRVEMPLTDFFAVGRAGAPATRSLLLGAYGSGELYCYFPMPFFTAASVELRRPPHHGAGPPVTVRFAVRHSGCAPLRGSGPFGAQRRVTGRTAPGRDATVLELAGRGRWVGLFAEVGSLAGRSREYLEGDEHVFVNGATAPTLSGTGVEDFFGGGFYFRVGSRDPVPFSRPLHGLVYDLRERDGRTALGMYRLMLTDAVPFSSSLRVGLECGPTNNLPIRLLTVAYYYLQAAR